MNTFTTPKGTVLPLLDLKGKNYLQVPHRIVWFCEEKPNWSIETTCEVAADSFCVMLATIKDENGRLVRTARKREDKTHFQDFMEKAETGAIGRALALLGYGTQFAIELDESERIVDSPLPSAKQEVTKSDSTAPKQKQTQAARPNNYAPNAMLYKDYVVDFGKHKGKQVMDMGIDELMSYVTFLEDSARRDKKPLSQKSALFVQMAQAYVDSEKPGQMESANDVKFEPGPEDIPNFDSDQEIPF